MAIKIILVDYQNNAQACDLVYLLNCYAEDVMGGGESLSEYSRQHVAAELSKIPHAFSVMAYVDDKPAGLTNCFTGFSTFACKPLVNIHDLIVKNEYRGIGISQLMLTRVEDEAKRRGCCKLTLEVLEGNDVAQKSYRKFGFAGYELVPMMGNALFMQKKLLV